MICRFCLRPWTPPKDTSGVRNLCDTCATDLQAIAFEPTGEVIARPGEVIVRAGPEDIGRFSPRTELPILPLPEEEHEEQMGRPVLELPGIAAINTRAIRKLMLHSEEPEKERIVVHEFLD